MKVTIEYYTDINEAYIYSGTSLLIRVYGSDAGSEKKNKASVCALLKALGFTIGRWRFYESLACYEANASFWPDMP